MFCLSKIKTNHHGDEKGDEYYFEYSGSEVEKHNEWLEPGSQNDDEDDEFYNMNEYKEFIRVNVVNYGKYRECACGENK